MHDAHVEMTGPVAIGRTRNHVPVVVRLEIDEHGHLAGGVDDVRERQVRERCPAHKVRVRLEREVIIVEEGDLGIARIDHGMACTGLFECVVVTRGHCPQMVRVQGAQGRVLVAVVVVHGENHTLLLAVSASAIIDSPA